jgi:hypothetical protein
MYQGQAWRPRAIVRSAAAAAIAGLALIVAPLGTARTAGTTQRAELTGSDAVAGSFVGASVAISNSTAVVTGGGAAYVYVRSGSGAWTEQAKLTRPGGSLVSVAVSGDTIVAGASGNDLSAGGADVFVRSGGSWSLQAELTPGDGASRDGFGSAVAIFGPRIVVGSPFRMQEVGSRGAAYLFVRSVSTWSQQAELVPRDLRDNDQFGTSVSIYRSTAIVGAPGIFQSGTPGRAYVFARSGASWTQQAELTASDGKPFDEFGTSVSIAGSTAVVGADAAGSQAGAAYVYSRSGGTWSQQARLVPSDTVKNDHFGDSVAISGDTVVAGARLKKAPNGRAQAGSAYAFVRSGAAWTQQQRLLASDAGVGDQLGRAVALSGTRALVGAPLHAGNVGAAYVFVLPAPPA